MRCGRARRAARNNEELGSLELLSVRGGSEHCSENSAQDPISLSYLPEELVATIIQVAADVRRLPLHSVLGPYGRANLVPPGTSLEGLL